MRARRGMTLMEQVVVVLILAILASGTFSLARKHRLSATASTILRNVNTIHAAADLHLAKHGRLPADVHRGQVPQDFAEFMDTSIFTSELPHSALYDWNGPGGKLQYGMSIVFPRGTLAVSRPLYAKLEELADDGDGSAGWITVSNERILFSFR